jgi:hypothetical protein
VSSGDSTEERETTREKPRRIQPDTLNDKQLADDVCELFARMRGQDLNL